ncbi:hypothetical protein TIFTF001_027190 [Ficus carica]|uniref:Uncharacterized protein n=1 Tax=Ficus carica TaxID=3494 RepID=A0AA88DMI1_FICCA|nr:hypothetical protein TIFTF001_027190 [Ficus carica]
MLRVYGYLTSTRRMPHALPVGRAVEAGAEAGTKIAGTGWRGRGSTGQPPRRGLGRGRGSVDRASTLGPDGGMLEIPKRELILGISSPTEVVVDQPGDLRRVYN